MTLDPIEIQETLDIISQNKDNLKEIINTLPKNHRLIPLEQEDFKVFNPNTVTCPTFNNRIDLYLLKQFYKKTDILIKRDPETNKIISNPWEITFLRMFDPAIDSNHFLQENQLIDRKFNKKINVRYIPIYELNDIKFLPIYEGRMIWQYNHRLNSMEFATKGKQRKAISLETKIEQFQDSSFSVKTNYWLNKELMESRIPEDYNKKWFLGFRAVSGATNERSFISTILPYTPMMYSITLIITKSKPKLVACLLANLNSIVFDFIVRQKLSNPRINHFEVEQFPIFPPEKYNSKLMEIIDEKVLELIYTSFNMKNFASDLDYNGEPFKFSQERRDVLIAELDAIYAILYNIDKDNLEYIIDSFSVLKNRELERFEEFLTKRLILEAYDKFLEQKELFE
ncbi:hypothetical protein ES703_54087 [subsurface metagenome]